MQPKKIPVFDFVKNPEEKQAVVLGGSLHSVHPPPPPGHPPHCDIHQKVDEKPGQRGGTGMLPLGWLALWKREGVSLQLPVRE